MAHTLPDLPFSADALSPVISAETLEFHHGKHHNAYVTNLNKLIEGTPDAEKSLEDLITSSSGGVFNNAAQHFNHSFYWKGLGGGGGAPSGALADAINSSFGSFDDFKGQFTQAALTQFGSGWAWLVKKGDGSLAVTKTANADTPLTDGDTPLLTCDVWEHAYYIDYRNARPKYVEEFWKIVNWDHASACFGA